MSGKKAVDKVSKGLTSLIDEFSSAVKEIVNAGETTVVELAVGSSRVIKAAINATGEVTKITVETASNVVGAVSDGVVRAVNPNCLLYTSPSPRDMRRSRMPSSA